jgi:hypothetical protein
MHDTSTHADILHSLRALATEITALKRAGIEIDEGQFLAVLDLIDSGLNQVIKKMGGAERPDSFPE